MKNYKILTHRGIPVDAYTLVRSGEIRGTDFPRLHPTYKTLKDVKQDASMNASIELRGKVVALVDECELNEYTLERRLLPSEEKPGPETPFTRRSEHRGVEMVTQIIPFKDIVKIIIKYTINGKEYDLLEECRIDTFPLTAVAMEHRVRFDITAKQNR